MATRTTAMASWCLVANKDTCHIPTAGRDGSATGHSATEARTDAPEAEVSTEQSPPAKGACGQRTHITFVRCQQRWTGAPRSRLSKTPGSKRAVHCDQYGMLGSGKCNARPPKHNRLTDESRHASPSSLLPSLFRWTATHRASAGAGGCVAGAVSRAVAQAAAGCGHQQHVAHGLAGGRVAAQRVPQRQVQRVVLAHLQQQQQQQVWC